MTRDEFLNLVEDYIVHDPESAAHVATRVQIGLREAVGRANARASDMEAALAIACNSRFKGGKQQIIDLLKFWDGKTALRWDWLTKEKSDASQADR